MNSPDHLDNYLGTSPESIEGCRACKIVSVNLPDLQGHLSLTLENGKRWLVSQPFVEKFYPITPGQYLVRYHTGREVVGVEDKLLQYYRPEKVH